MLSFIIINVISLLINIKLFLFNGAIANGYLNAFMKIQIPHNFTSRDFIRYECKNLQKFGEIKNYLKEGPDELKKTSKIWYICMDHNIGPSLNKCNVLSINIQNNDNFDKEMNSNYGCNVETIDPFIKHTILTDLRERNLLLKDRINIHLNYNWRFQRTDIIGSNLPEISSNKPKTDGILRRIISITGFENKLIDVLKIDIEKAEWVIFEDGFDIDYLCNHVKQFIIETHPIQLQPGINIFHYNNLKKLEKCFFLYHRITKMFDHGFQHKQEFNQIMINLNEFKDESDVIDYILAFGRLYFLNKNFVQL
jgi:hypothetical protein